MSSDLDFGLPACDGPKLQPFQGGGPVEIDFKRSIANTDRSYVYEVSIDGRTYALKMFKFFAPWRLGVQLNKGTEKLGITWKDVANHMDHFNCECRAYGRLKEFGREDLAVKCHGYIMLTAEQEDYLRERGCTDWRRGPDTEDEGRPIPCIVKDFLPSKVSYTGAMLPRMIRDMEDLHKYGIFHRDVKENNYIDGVIIDFDNSWTTPHVMWQIEQAGTYVLKNDYDDPILDLGYLDEFVEEWNKKHETKVWARGLVSLEYTKKLRKPRQMDELLKYDPADFDLREGWLRKERDRALRNKGTKTTTANDGSQSDDSARVAKLAVNGTVAGSRGGKRKRATKVPDTAETVGNTNKRRKPVTAPDITSEASPRRQSNRRKTKDNDP